MVGLYRMSCRQGGRKQLEERKVYKVRETEPISWSLQRWEGMNEKTNGGSDKKEKEEERGRESKLYASSVEMIKRARLGSNACASSVYM